MVWLTTLFKCYKITSKRERRYSVLLHCTCVGICLSILRLRDEEPPLTIRHPPQYTIVVEDYLHSLTSFLQSCIVGTALFEFLQTVRSTCGSTTRGTCVHVPLIKKKRGLLLSLSGSMEPPPFVLSLNLVVFHHAVYQQTLRELLYGSGMQLPARTLSSGRSREFTPNYFIVVRLPTSSLTTCHIPVTHAPHL